ncbi:MAG: DedA family protein, partial [Microcystaceae cyanobacterium]
MTHWFEHWIPQVMQQWSYLGIAFLMFIENVFPIIPAEVFMPLVGFTVSQGQIAFFPAVFAGVVGTILGAYPWYYVGKWVNEERLEHIADRYGKWVGI